VQQARSDFDQLVQSLQNGNLGAAQQAYADFQRVQASLAPRQSAAPDATSAAPGATAVASTALRSASQSPVSADWSSLGQALQTGNLGQAQNALDKLEGDAQTVWQSHLQQQIQNAQSVYALMQGANQDAMALPAQAGTVNGALSPSVQTDIASLGQSIQAGDSSAAQRLLSQLEQDIKSMSLAAGPASGGHLRDYSSAGAGTAGAAAGSAAGASGAGGSSAVNNISALDGPHPNNIAKVASALSAAGVQSARPLGIVQSAPPAAPSAPASTPAAPGAVASAGNAAAASAETHASPKAHAHKPEKHVA